MDSPKTACMQAQPQDARKRKIADEERTLLIQPRPILRSERWREIATRNVKMNAPAISSKFFAA